MGNHDQAMLHVVKMLKMAAPNSVNLVVIKVMQKACTDDWQERSKAGVPLVETEEEDAIVEAVTQTKPTLGRRRHRDLVKDIQTMATMMQGANKRTDSELKLSDI